MKKLHLYFLLLAALSLAFVSCDDDNSIRFLADDNSEITSAFVSSIEYTVVKAINMEGDFTITSDNEDIATAGALLDNSTSLSIQIVGHKKGSTFITVTDSKNKTAKLEVIVYDKELTFTVVEHFTIIETEEKGEESQTAIDKIKKEITDKLVPIDGHWVMTYRSEDKGDLIYYPCYENQKEKVEGNFHDKLEEFYRYFIFNYNEQEYKYRVELVVEEQYPLRYIYLILDFTDDYKDILQPKITKAEGVLTVMIN